GRHVREELGDEERVYLRTATLQNGAHGLVGVREAAAAVPADGADAGAVDAFEVEGGVGDRLLGCGDGELGEAGHAARVLAVHVLSRLEVLDVTANLAGVVLGIDEGQTADAGLAGDGARPHLLDAVTE